MIEMNNGQVRLYQGDSRDVLKTLGDASIDSIVCDPPYALVSIQKRFGKPGSAPAKGNDAYMRASAGFMAANWDVGETAFAETFWAECLRVLKPGGHVVAFGGTRTYHRLVCAIEDAGFEIRDQLGWVYGSGFPKSHNQTGDWEGWGSALKPAWEPICLARKPLTGTIAANLAAHGVGALNIDGCRVSDGAVQCGAALGSESCGCGWPETACDTDRKIGSAGWGGPMKRLSAAPGQEGRLVPRTPPSQLGRWPANIIHDGSDEVLAAFPDSNGSGSARTLKRGKRDDEGWGMASEPGELRDAGTGSAARFFYCAKASRKDRDEGLAHLPKQAAGHIASETGGGGGWAKDAAKNPNLPRANIHPTVKPTDLMRYLCRLITPPGGTILDPFMGSGSTGKGAVLEGFNFVGIEREDEYMPIAEARIAWAVLRAGGQIVDIEATEPANDNAPPDLFAGAA